MQAPITTPCTQVALHPGALPPLVIIADDLTGACDSAAAFLGKAADVSVLLNRPGRRISTILQPGNVVAVTTESRNLSASAAAHTVERVTRSFCGDGSQPLLFNKVDSAGRGHLAAETTAALCGSGACLALVAPAFPQAGRVVRNGTLEIRDVAQQDMKIDLPSLFPTSRRSWLDLLPAGEVSTLREAINRAIEHGTRVLLCDSETQLDLERLAQAAYGLSQPILWTGSAGLARAVGSLFSTIERGTEVEPSLSEGRTILFVGTDHPVTEMQVTHLQQASTNSGFDVCRVNWNHAAGTSVRAAFHQQPVAALILTGGDTAAFVLENLNASAIRLAGEIAPGIPWGYIKGGDADGRVVVTKSGGFGQHATLLQAFNFCSRRTCEPV